MASHVSLQEMLMGAQLFVRLPFFLRHRVTVAEAREIVSLRLQSRVDAFLALARRAIYENAESPYLQLLRMVGCEYGDLEGLVRVEGLEGALHILYQRGVYLTLDEFKGRTPVTRGSMTLALRPGQLRNPAAEGHIPSSTTGSRGHATPISFDLGYLREHAVERVLVFDAHRRGAWAVAVWDTPGGQAIRRAIGLVLAGERLARWFTPVDPSEPGLHVRYRSMVRVLRASAVLAGVPQPRPKHVPLEAPLPIAEWMAEVIGTGATPHLHAHVSQAVRVCQAASNAGIALRGAQFVSGGEPITPGRLAAIHRAGAQLVPSYAVQESGRIGFGCAAPLVADDLHVYEENNALIQPGEGGARDGLPPLALLVSTLRSVAPFVLLNVSLGDQGVLEQRTCGCALEQIGWTRHLHSVRSFEKLTAGGMTFLDTDVIRVLDEVLPARFGGGPTDYQLVEEEAEDGLPRVRLLVHPAVGPVDAEVVADAFLTGIGGGVEGERLMELQWRQAGLPRVERRPPNATEGGKINHIHLGRSPAHART
jgi:hypothetical protein